jgi:hypothetical protein
VTTQATTTLTRPAAFAAHPERFPRGAPRVPRPPAAVYINPLASDTVDVRSASDDLRVAHDMSSTHALTASRPGDGSREPHT